ncbi:MAG: hypothetical protein NVSMB6_31600 [Burkholderiaceae bacterium]
MTNFNNSNTGLKFHNGVLGIDNSTSNNDFNDGVEGVSYKGTGVFGATTFDSSHVPGSGYGVYAEDFSTTSNSNAALIAYSQKNTGIIAFTNGDPGEPGFFAPAIMRRTRGKVS